MAYCTNASRGLSAIANLTSWTFNISMCYVWYFTMLWRAYADVTFGRFTTELQDLVVEENQSFTLGFASATKPPDLIHILPNGTREKLIVSGKVTEEAKSDRTCQYSVGQKINVTISCTAALRQHAGTYIGTDNDDSKNAQKTFGHVIVVEGMKRVILFLTVITPVLV